MCGIAGYSCFSEERDERFSIAMLMLGLNMQERGRMAWGWTDGTQIVKATGPLRDRFNSSFFGFQKAALHTRHATTGANTEENAHPWQIGDLIGMHNGIVHNHEEMNKKYERDCKVDSMHIFHHLAEGKDMSELSAYGAVCFFKDGDIHIGRFNSGDLNLVRTNVGWMFASTRTALEEALRLSGLSKENPIFYKLREERCYRLQGKQLIRREDIKLNLGSYSRNWKKWEEGSGSGNPTHRYMPGMAGGTTNYQNRGYGVQDNRRFQGLLSGGSNSNDKEEPQGSKAEEKGTKKASSATGSNGANGDKKRLSDMTLKEKVILFVNQNIDANKPKANQKLEPDWKCGYCDSVLEDGKPTYLGHAMELICEECGTRYIEDLEGGPFTELPKEIMLVDALFKPGEQDETLDCDGCPEKLGRGEHFVHTKDDDFLCVQCFLLRAESTEAEHNITTNSDDDDDNASEQERIARAEDEYFESVQNRAPIREEKSGEKKTEIVVPMRVVPRQNREPLMNEAANLKKFGEGMMPNFRKRLLN